MATDPMVVYNAIVRLGGARLDRLVEEFKPLSQQTISRLIQQLASPKMNMIHRAGYKWFPVRDLCSGSGTQLTQEVRDLCSATGTQLTHLGDLCSGPGTQLTQKCVNSSQLTQVTPNDVLLHSSENTLHGPLLGEDLLTIADTAAQEGDLPGIEASTSGDQKEIDATAPLSLTLRGAGSEAYGSEANGMPFPINNRFTLENHPKVMRHIVQKVRKARSRHNRGEGAKSAKARDKGTFYTIKLVPRGTIMGMVDLDLDMCKSVAHGTWWEDEAMHVSEMTRLIPDWRGGYKKALQDLGMVGPAEEEAPATEPEPEPLGLLDDEATATSIPATEVPAVIPPPALEAVAEPEPIGKDCVEEETHVKEDMTGTYAAGKTQSWDERAAAIFAAADEKAAPTEDFFEYAEGLAQKEAAAIVEEPVIPPAPEVVTEPILFKTRKGKIWKIGQDVACLQDELKFTKGEAESLLIYGKDAGQILAIVKNSWELYSKAKSRVVYLQEILSGGKKANNPAEPTEQTPSPVPPAPLPMEKQAKFDAAVRDAIRALGNGKYTIEEIIMQFARNTGVTCNKVKLQEYVDGMVTRFLVHCTPGCNGIVRYGLPVTPRKGRDLSPAEAAFLAQKPPTPPPAQEAATEPAAAPADEPVTLDEKIVQDIRTQPGYHNIESLVKSRNRPDAAICAALGRLGKTIRKIGGRYSMAADAQKPAIAQNDGMESSQWLN